MAESGKYYSADAALPVTSATQQQMVSVIAPSNLAEGYKLNAVVNGQSVQVTVPPGGVKEGQEFTAAVVGGGTVADPHHIPHGSWRDGLFHCFGAGPCHPSLCLTFWCAPLSLAQIMTRMKLNWCGQQKGSQAASKTWLYILMIFLAYIGIDQVLDAFMLHYAPIASDENEYTVAYSTQWWIVYSIRIALRIVFFLYFLLLTIRTRKTIRKTYDIPEQQCGGCEDCCCSYWCSCCTISQMSRHTADYDTYPGSCCAKNGLGKSAPDVVIV